MRCLIKPEWRGLVSSQLRQSFQAAMSKIVFIFVLFCAKVFAQDEVFIGKMFDLAEMKVPVLKISAFSIHQV